MYSSQKYIVLQCSRVLCVRVVSIMQDRILCGVIQGVPLATEPGIS